MLDLDNTQSGNDLEINGLHDESHSDISDLDDDRVTMEEPSEQGVPI